MKQNISQRQWVRISRQVQKEIMNTDIFCEIHCEKNEKEIAKRFLEDAFTTFRDFEKRYSRFREGNDLWALNEGARTVVTQELFKILEVAKTFHETTGGLYDPSILPALESEGYRGAYAKHVTKVTSQFEALRLEPETMTVEKPARLKIDLGGIGKGFVADKVAKLLGSHFDNFVVDAGGDIYTSGTNRVCGYDYWAIGLEQSGNQEEVVLMLSNNAVATSGTTRKSWERNGEEKHHLIDPKTGKSAQKDFRSVTVIAPDVITADVWAKTLFIAGDSKAQALAYKNRLPAIFIHTDNRIEINVYAEPYIWK